MLFVSPEFFTNRGDAETSAAFQKRKMQWDIFVGSLAIVTIYTVTSVSIRGNFSWDGVLHYRGTLISRFSGGNFVRVRNPIRQQRCSLLKQLCKVVDAQCMLCLQKVIA